MTHFCIEKNTGPYNYRQPHNSGGSGYYPGSNNNGGGHSGGGYSNYNHRRSNNGGGHGGHHHRHNNQNHHYIPPPVPQQYNKPDPNFKELNGAAFFIGQLDKTVNRDTVYNEIIRHSKQAAKGQGFYRSSRKKRTWK